MRGVIAISEDQVKNNRMGWSVFDFFKFELRHIVSTTRAGWIGYIKRDGIYYFEWIDDDEPPPSRIYMLALKADGYTVAITGETIENAFPLDETLHS